MATEQFVPAVSPRPRNLILAQFPETEYAALAKFLVPVDLPLSKSLSEPNQPIEYVYFLNTGLISTDAMTEKGESVEVGVIGREGFSGSGGVAGPAADVALGGDAGDGRRVCGFARRSFGMSF